MVYNSEHLSGMEEASVLTADDDAFFLFSMEGQWILTVVAG